MCFSKVDFGYPAALCNVHFAITLLGVEILYRFGVFEKLKPSLKDPNFLVMVLVVGVVTPLNNTSLQLNTVGFYQIFKLLVTPSLLLLEYFLSSTSSSTFVFVIINSANHSVQLALLISHTLPLRLLI